MANKSKKSRTQSPTPNPGAAASPPAQATTQAQPQPTVAGPTPAGNDQGPQMMKKGVYLSALVYVEGMQAPADDFTALAKSALTGALQGDHNGLSITLKKAQVQNNVDDEADSSTGGKGSFEF